MLNKLCYKGFTSTPIYSIKDKVIYGHVDDVYGEGSHACGDPEAAAEMQAVGR